MSNILDYGNTCMYVCFDVLFFFPFWSYPGNKTGPQEAGRGRRGSGESCGNRRKCLWPRPPAGATDTRTTLLIPTYCCRLNARLFECTVGGAPLCEFACMGGGLNTYPREPHHRAATFFSTWYTVITRWGMTQKRIFSDEYL